MFRAVNLIALSIVLLPNAALAATPLDCTAFLTGDWAGKGEVEAFGQTIKLDNAMWLRADGTFKTDYRFQNPGEEWQSQVVEGKWSAELGEGPNDCLVLMEISGTTEGGGTYSSSSTAAYIRVDDNTLTSMDFAMQRVTEPVAEASDKQKN